MRNSGVLDKLSELRRDFPILEQTVHGYPLVYLDNAASTQKPRCVIEAIRHFYERDNSNVHRGLHELSNRATEAFESARAVCARFLNAAKPEEIVFTRGTTHGINLVARAYASPRLRAGDRILLTEMEHHSNLVPWQMVANRTGAQLAFVPVTPEGLLDCESIDALLGPPTKIFAFTHVSNTLGTVNNAAELCARAKAQGVTTVVDGAQSAGHRPVNVREIGCDFFVCSGHKMCGPTGIGILYGRQEVLAAMDPDDGGGEMIDRVAFERSEWKAPPWRFEAGTPNIAGAIGLAAGLDYLETVGRDKIAAHDAALAALAYELVSGIPGIRILGPSSGRAGMLTFTLGSIHAHDVVEVANRFGVALRGGHHCNQPLMRKLGTPATARASFYFYNLASDVERFAVVLNEVRNFFGDDYGT
jgi:cysteine desulfurase/selenocysteine lyase